MPILPSPIKSLQSYLINNIDKPFKIDIRSVCEHNVFGPITRTFDVKRSDLIKLLQDTSDTTKTEGVDIIIDRIDITEYPEEGRLTVHNPSRMEQPIVPKLRNVSSSQKEWDLDPQYGEGSARNSSSN